MGGAGYLRNNLDRFQFGSGRCRQRLQSARSNSAIDNQTQQQACWLGSRNIVVEGWFGGRGCGQASAPPAAARASAAPLSPWCGLVALRGRPVGLGWGSQARPTRGRLFCLSCPGGAGFALATAKFRIRRRREERRCRLTDLGQVAIECMRECALSLGGSSRSLPRRSTPHWRPNVAEVDTFPQARQPTSYGLLRLRLTAAGAFLARHHWLEFQCRGVQMPVPKLPCSSGGRRHRPLERPARPALGSGPLPRRLP